MANILEYDPTLGQVVTVDTKNDVYVPESETGAVMESMIPSVAKNQEIAYMGGPLVAVKALQNALNRLAAFVKNNALRTKPDGYMGPKTQAATHAGLMAIKANVQMPISQAGIKAQAATFAKMFDAYIAEKNKKPAPKVAAFRVVKQESSARLQRALNALAPLVNDNALAVKVDGYAGEKTWHATNLAFAKYVPTSTTLPLSNQGVQSGANNLAAAVENQVARLRVAAQKKAAANQAAVEKAKQAEPAKAPTFTKASIVTLQKALVSLGLELKNKALSGLAVDGMLGPKTQAATNLALSRYVSGADANLKTGKLTRETIGKGAMALATLVMSESIRRKEAKLKPVASPETKEQAEAAKTQKTVEAVKKAAPPATRPTIDKALVKLMQLAVAKLGAAVKNAALKIKDDGIVGPNTRAAVNLALSRYVRNASRAMKSGLTTRIIGLAAPSITKLINGELALLSQEQTRREADAKKAKEKLGPAATAKVADTAKKAASGNKDAQDEIKKVAAAAVSSNDPEVQDKARDMMDVAVNAIDVEMGPAEIVPSDNDREIWAYTDERKIRMPLDTIEDDAELGAMIGMGEHLHGDGTVGWGIPKFIKRGYRKAKRSVKRAARKTYRKARRIGRKGWRLARRGMRAVVALHKLPMKLQMKLIRRLGLPIAKRYCRLPKSLQTAGARAAGVDPRIMVLFCDAINKRLGRRIRKLFPQAMKVAVKLALQGSFPAAIPVIQTMKAIPGVNRLPGMSFLSGDLAALDQYVAGMGASLNVGTCGGSMLLSDPHMIYDDLELDEPTTMDGDLSDPPGWEYLREDTPDVAVLGAYWDDSETGACSDCY